MEFLALLLAKAGAATLTTKVVVAGAVSAVTIGTAGATGVVPVAALLPDDSSTVVVEEDRSAIVPAETTDPADDVDADVPVEGPEDPALEDPALEDAPEDAGTSAVDALEAARSKAPEQAHAGLDRALAAVTGAGEREPAAGGAEQGTRPTAQPQRPAPAQPVAPEAERGTGQAGSAPEAGSGATDAGNGAGRN